MGPKWRFILLERIRRLDSTLSVGAALKETHYPWMRDVGWRQEKRAD